MRKLATIDVIRDVQPIPGADRIEVYTIRAWQVVDLKGKYQVGDKVIYVEADAFLPLDPAYEFLRKTCYKKWGDKEGFRLRTIKLRGQFSQGLILDPIQFPDAQIGDDVTEALGIELYEPPIPTHLRGEVKGSFPYFIRKTSQERVQNLEYEDLRKTTWVVTEKLNGTSLTVYVNQSSCGVCSCNQELKPSKKNSYWRIVKELDLEEKLLGLDRNLALQGELIGGKIQGNPYRKTKHELYIFNVFDIDRQVDLPFEEQIELVNQLGLTYVPILALEEVLPEEVKDLINSANGKSQLKPEINREGLVLRDLNSSQTFKILSNNYLLKEEE